MRRPLRSEKGRELANLAIDLGDPGRMARARRLYRGGAVGAIRIDGGTISALILDENVSYDATLSVALPFRGSSDVPDAAAVEVSSCSCDVTPGPCKHVLALLLSFAEEVEVEPDLLHEWTHPAAEEHAATSAVSTDGDEFFAGPWDDSLEPFVFADAPQTGDANITVEGVDAWPAIRDAIEVAAETRSRP